MSLINFSGLASGIDSNALISAMLQQSRKAQAQPLQNKIQGLTDTNAALGELTSLLSELKSAASSFRAVNGGAISKIATSSNEAVATAVASNAASSGTYSLSVSQLARSATYSFADRFLDGSSPINSAISNAAPANERTVTVTVGTGSNQESISIELTNTSTVQEFVDAFNTQSNSAEASLVNVGTSSSPSYAVVITSLNQGTDRGQIGVSVGTQVQTAGSGAFVTTSATLQQATNSQFTVSGIGTTISRSTNSVSDVVSGVTFNLQSTGSSTISIAQDTDSSRAAIQKFVETFNRVFEFTRENDRVRQEQEGSQITNIFEPLASTELDENLLSSIRSAVASSSRSGGVVNTLADLGVTTSRDGTLSFNAETFATALSQDAPGVEAITRSLGERLAAVSGTIAEYTRFNGVIDIAERGNEAQIDSLNARLGEIESQLLKQQSALTSRFARLESLVGRLNNQQSALSNVLPR